MIRTIRYYLDRIEFLWEWKVLKKYVEVIEKGDYISEMNNNLLEE